MDKPKFDGVERALTENKNTIVMKPADYIDKLESRDFRRISLLAEFQGLWTKYAYAVSSTV